jgi:CheY-like chemotaxis protein
MNPVEQHLAPIIIHSIILADDERNDHDFFRDALRDIHHSIRLSVVDDGAELLLTLQHYLPDMLFLDLDMPIKNGLECLREIRNNPTTEDLPVVVFSSTTRSVNIDTAYAMGADLFFIKPSTFSDLKSALLALLSLDWHHPHEVREQYCVNGRYTAFM